VLLSHLKSHFLETSKNPQHYDFLFRNLKWVNTRIANLNPAGSLELLDKELRTLEIEIRPLTKQTPYTLLMMRVVEIGLPILLSFFSIFFILRYSLTEKRSHEIKDLLKQRNQEKSDGRGINTVPVTEG
jgi:Na+/melibiose symporter-like transporter